mgnify:CR=1 FL=1
MESGHFVIRPFFRWKTGWDQPLIQLATAVSAGLLVGLALLILPPWGGVVLLGTAIAGFAALKRPELGILAILFFVSSVLPESDIPVFEVGPVLLYLVDFVFAALAALILVRLLVEPDFHFRHTPLDMPFVAFYGIAGLATVAAILQSRLEIGASLPEMRTITYYLTFFLVVNLVCDDRQYRLLVRGMWLLGGVVAAAMIVQFILGTDVRIMPGRVEQLATEGVKYSDVTRITDFSGESLLLSTFVMRTVFLALDPVKARQKRELALWGMMGVGVVLTFNRNFWIGVGLGMLLLWFLLRGRDRVTLMRLGVLTLLVVTITGTIALALPGTRFADLVGASINRLTSLGRSQAFASQESTFRWRDFEYRYSLPAIGEHPFLGIGMGAPYRPFVFAIDHENFDGRAYTHNAHVWIMVKTGLFGYLAFAWLCALFLIRAFAHWRTQPNALYQSVMLGGAITFLAVIVGSIVNPMFMQWWWTPVIGVMMGLNEVALKDTPAASPAVVP